MKKFISIIFVAILMHAQNPKMTIYKPVTGTCKESWISDIGKEVAQTEVVSLTNVKGLKYSIGIPRELYSCNTSILEDYVFEGNVPIKAIEKFMNEKPKGAIGLSLPTSQNDEKIKKVYIIYDDKRYKLYGNY